MAASFKRAAVFSNVQQHGEISILYFTFILILGLPCLFWCYPLCVYKSSTLFLYFCLLVLLYMVFMSIYPYLLFETQLIRMCVLNITVWREVFEKFLRTKLFLVKFQTFSLQAFTFLLKLIPNFQTRHLLWSLIQITLKFQKGDNSSWWSFYADQNVLLNKCS